MEASGIKVFLDIGGVLLSIILQRMM